MVDTVDTLEERGLLMPNLRPKLNLKQMLNTLDIPLLMDTMVDIIHVLTDMDITDTDILERDLLMLNLRLNLSLKLMLNMDTMDIQPPMDTMVDIILMLTDMDTTDTDILERDLLMLNLNPNTTIIDTTTVDSIMDTTIGDTMVDSLGTTIIEMFDRYLI